MLNQNNKNTIQTIISNECIDYPEAIAFMEKRVEKIRTNINSELIWLLHHPSIYTVGKSSNNSDFLKNPQIPIYKTDRGGQITYHGPGQRIAYFMINLNNSFNFSLQAAGVEERIASIPIILSLGVSYLTPSVS